MGGKIVGDGGLLARATPTSARSSPRSSSQKPDAIYVPGYYTDVGLIARQARELGIKAPLLGGDGWDSREAVRARRQRRSRAATSPTTTRAEDPQPARAEVHRRVQGGLRRGAGLAGGARLRRGEGGDRRDEARARTSTGPALRDAIAADQGLPRRDRHHHPRREAQRGEAGGGAEGRRTARRKYVRHRRRP